MIVARRPRFGVAELTGTALLLTWAVWFSVFDVLHSSPALIGWQILPWWVWSLGGGGAGLAHLIAVYWGSRSARRRCVFLRATMLVAGATLSARYGIQTLACPTFVILAIESTWVYAGLREKKDAITIVLPAQRSLE